MKTAIFYSGEFGNRVAGNLVNYSGFCISCGEACSQCRTAAPELAGDIVALIEMPDPASLGDFIDDVEPLVPQNVPLAEIAVVINIHPDILFGLLPRLKEAGVRGIVGGSESPRELPLGLRSSWKTGPQSLEWRPPLPNRSARFVPIRPSRSSPAF